MPWLTVGPPYPSCSWELFRYRKVVLKWIGGATSDSWGTSLSACKASVARSWLCIAESDHLQKERLMNSSTWEDAIYIMTMREARTNPELSSSFAAIVGPISFRPAVWLIRVSGPPIICSHIIKIQLIRLCSMKGRWMFAKYLVGVGVEQIKDGVHSRPGGEAYEGVWYHR